MMKTPFRAFLILLCAFVASGQRRVAYAPRGQPTRVAAAAAAPVANPSFNPVSYNRKLEIDGQYGLRLSGSAPRNPRPPQPQQQRQPPAPGNEEPFRFEFEPTAAPLNHVQRPNRIGSVNRFRFRPNAAPIPADQQYFDGPQGPVNVEQPPRPNPRHYVVDDREPIEPGYPLSVPAPSEGPPLYFHNDHQESSEEDRNEPQPFDTSDDESFDEPPDNRSLESEPTDAPAEHRELDEEEPVTEPPRPKFGHFSHLDPRPLPRPTQHLPDPVPVPAGPSANETAPAFSSNPRGDKDPFFDAPRIHDPQIAQRQKDWSQYIASKFPPTPSAYHHTKNFQLLSQLPHLHIGAPISSASAIPFQIPLPDAGPILVKAPGGPKGQFIQYPIPRHTFYHPILPLVRHTAAAPVAPFNVPGGGYTRSFINGQPVQHHHHQPQPPFSFIQPMFTRTVPIHSGLPRYFTQALPMAHGHPPAFYIPRPATMVTGAPPIMAHHQPAQPQLTMVTAPPPQAPAMAAEIHPVKTEIHEPVLESGNSPDQPVKFSIMPMVNPIKLNMPTTSGHVTFEPMAGQPSAPQQSAGSRTRMPLQTIRIDPPELQSVELIKPMSRDGSSTEMVSIPIPTMRTMHEPMYYGVNGNGAVAQQPTTAYQPRYNPGDPPQPVVASFRAGVQYVDEPPLQNVPAPTSFRTVGHALRLPLTGVPLNAAAPQPQTFSLNTYGGQPLRVPSAVTRPRKREAKRKSKRRSQRPEEDQHGEEMPKKMAAQEAEVETKQDKPNMEEMPKTK